MPSWGDLLGQGSVAEQLLVWGVANEVIGQIMGPTLELVRQKLNEANPVAVLSPADLADMVVRGIKTQDQATTEAGANGIDPDRFNDLVLDAGEPPGLETVLEMYRRKIIGWTDDGVTTASVERAIKTSRVYNYWSDAIQANAQVPITVGEAVNALLRGQTDQATALSEAEANGINPDRFQILLDSAGRPPSPGELVELLRRKLIPEAGVGPGVVSFQQGIFEGDSKDKWWELYAALQVYLPPPRTVITLLKTGSITADQAAGYFSDAGLDETTVAAYLKSAQGEKLAGSKQLAEATVLTLYTAGAVTAQAATDHLTALGYDVTDVAVMLELTDLRREVQVLNAAVNRVGSMYMRHKITRPAAVTMLNTLDVNPAHRDRLMELWDIEAATNVQQLTAGQIQTAVEYSNLDGPTAIAELMSIGYTEFDAWVIASNGNKGPLPNMPAPNPQPLGVLP